MSKELQKLESWKKELALIETFEELKLIGDSAEAYQNLMQRQKIAKTKQDEVGEFIIEVEEHKGGWLNEHFPHGGDSPSPNDSNFEGTAGAPSKMPTTKKESARARRLLKTREMDPDLYESIKQKIKESDTVLTPAALDIAIKRPHVVNNSGENEWYTPSEYIESARKVMGSIDLDPASSDLANKTVDAFTYYTAETNGLNKKWEGNVWLNPPYAQPLINQFSSAVVKKREHYNQIIVLVNNATETSWFQNMAEISSAICFPKGRLKFIDMGGNPSGAPLQGQAFIYIGPNKDDFIKEFSRYGICLMM